MHRHKRWWSRVAVGAVLLTLAGVMPASAATPTPAPTTPADRLTTPPSATPAAREQQAQGLSAAVAAAGPGIPTSGKNLEAGPSFEKSGGKWQVRATEAVLRNTVTDPDGDKADLTFDVWTVNADGSPKAHVDTTNANPYGTPVSPYVKSGEKASVTIDYGYLHPGWTYVFRTSAYDGAHYEQEWSPWATFTVAPYVTFPAAQSSSSIDSKAQKPQRVTRTQPGTFVPIPLTKNNQPKSSCGKPDSKGQKLCWQFRKPSQKHALKKTAARLPGSQYDLLPWCESMPKNDDYLTRTDACMRDLGQGTLIFTDTEPGKPPIGKAVFEFEQRIKAYPSKKEGGGDNAEFDQQLLIIPIQIDPQLQIVRMKWRIGSDCTSCVTSQPIWQDSYGAGRSEAFFTPAPTDMGNPLFGTVQTRWTGTGKETIDLGWKVEASVDAGGNLAIADFGGSGIDSSRELAPRCDDLLKNIAPGCVMWNFKPTWTIDTNKYPAAGAYYWLMQERMTDHAGAPRWDSLLHYLGPDTSVKNSSGLPWTSEDSRNPICKKKWNPHKVPASVGTTSCDEYAMASTHESGGFPQSPNKVTDGSQCAQLYADAVSGGNTAFGMLADVGQQPGGLSTHEKCGRANLPADQNSGAFRGYPVPDWRMLDNDGFFVDTPGFDHCKKGVVTCDWEKIG